MSKHRTLAAALVSALVLAGLTASQAAAQANCDWYARTALKQQQDNERLKCGFKGPEWNADLRAHLNWCTSVAPDVWREQAKKRDQQLATCAKR